MGPNQGPRNKFIDSTFLRSFEEKKARFSQKSDPPKYGTRQIFQKKCRYFPKDGSLQGPEFSLLHGPQGSSL